MQHLTRVLGVALAVIVLSGPAQAANDPLIVWQGGATITSLNAVCRQNTGFAVGNLAHSIFRPRLVGDEPRSALSLLFTSSAQLIINSDASDGDQMHGQGSYTGPLIRGRATTVSGGVSGTYNFKIKPNVITDTTKVITIAGTINDFFGVVGCTMKFLGAYQRRPN